MSAASNSAIRSFLDTKPADATASTLSTLVQALQNQAVSADLASTPANAALLKEVLDRLVALANDGAKATAVRLMGLECLYSISAGASDVVRQGPLFLAVQSLNASFDDMMEREADALTAQQEMLAVLLLRCTGYTKLKAGDVLQQLCGGDDRKLVTLLLSMLRNPTYEWALMQAALRWLYELTTPATYFTAESATETTKVHAFQAKVGALLEHFNASHALTQVLAQLVELWRRSAATGLGPALSHCESITSVAVLTSTQQRELLQWAVVLRYVSVLVHNLSEFCDRPELARQMQRSFVAQSQPFLAELLIPFSMAAVHAWERSEGRRGGAADPASLATQDMTRDPNLNAAIAAMRLLRFALYRSSSVVGAGGGAAAGQTPAATSTTAPVALQAPLLSSLAASMQFYTRLEPALKQEYPGMLLLLLSVQCGCNANATTLRSGGNVHVATAFDTLVATVANDKAAIRADSPYAASLAFTICFNREDSPFVETQNESVRLVHTKLAQEESELKQDAETLDAIVAMQEQLEYLQAIIMQAALGQLLAELGAMSDQLNRQDAATSSAAAQSNPLLLGRAPSTATTPMAESPATRSKKVKKAKQHPAEYVCQLTNKLMREPVVLRNGHRFEYDALMDVVNRVGHVDPLTGEDVQEEFEVDESLRQEIADYRVARAAKK